ncbi:CRISPR-associated endonuclease Cas3'' [Halobaculum sp. MBLA0147]|uniref:CRISPR-associated endonuclease Cas3'' n=1 Tax=Halobaculum sp. MBLA0147 TaxID=3079934 RepID=UPI003523AED0
MTTPDDLISHPDHPDGNPHLSVPAHSAAVRRRIQPLIDDSAELSTVANVSSYLHDFGKVTPQFQAYIHPDREFTGPDAERYHARLGAIVTLYALDALDIDLSWLGAGVVAVGRHHQRLPDAASYLFDTLRSGLGEDPLKSQIDEIDDAWPAAADTLIAEATKSVGSWKGFQTAFNSGRLSNLLFQLAGREELTGSYVSSDSIPSTLYERTLHLWGSLTLADKSHAKPVAPEKIHNFDTLETEPLAKHINSLAGSGDSELEAALNEARRGGLLQVLGGIHEWNNQPDASQIGEITLPTGLGKTFTGLMAALTLRDQTTLLGRQPSVIYCLPYTAIIEQTREHFEDPAIWGVSPQADAFTADHYLTDTVVQHEDEAIAERTFLGESWRSGVVLTTFVQLFESLTGPSNQAGMKLSALDNAVVILDEPQALPKSWWDGVQRLLEILTDEFGARVISMTATQPALLDGVETVSLLDAGISYDGEVCNACLSGDVPDRAVESYYDEADRVTYEIWPSATCHALGHTTEFVGYDTAAAEILEAAGLSGSAMAVCNTIASCRTLTDAIEAAGPVQHIGATYQRLLEEEEVAPRDDIDATVDTLLNACGLTKTGDDWETAGPTDTVFTASFSSRFRPVDREVLLGVVDALSTSVVPFVFVSTQAVEAGVDVSFQHVFRDIAPIDSIVQAGGRCNRNFEWGRRGGTVTVWTLAGIDEPNPTEPVAPCPASFVYERDIPGHLRLIADTLVPVSDGPVSEREMCYETVRAYFDTLSSEKSVATTAIREEIDRGDAAALAERSLIGGYETVDMLLPLSADERTAVDGLVAALEDDDTVTAQETVSALSDIRVSLPVETVDAVTTDAQIEIGSEFELLIGPTSQVEYDTVDGIVGPDEAAGGSTEI